MGDGCGIARFGWRGLKKNKLENFGLKVCPQHPRGATHGPRWAAYMEPQGAAQGFEGKHFL